MKTDSGLWTVKAGLVIYRETEKKPFIVKEVGLVDDEFPTITIERSFSEEITNWISSILIASNVTTVRNGQFIHIGEQDGVIYAWYAVLIDSHEVTYNDRKMDFKPLPFSTEAEKKLSPHCRDAATALKAFIN